MKSKLPIAQTADVTQLECLRAGIEGRACVVVGSAPLKTPKAVIEPGEYVIAINGAASSIAGFIDLWQLNSKLQDGDPRQPLRALHKVMVEQGRNVRCGHVAFLRGPKYATEPLTLAWLDKLHCAYQSWSVIDKQTKLWFEQTHCGRRGLTEACSSGLFAIAVALWCGAARVRVLGCSFKVGYHYLPKQPLPAAWRGHVEADKRALGVLLKQHGNVLDLSAVPGFHA